MAGESQVHHKFEVRAVAEGGNYNVISFEIDVEVCLDIYHSLINNDINEEEYNFVMEIHPST